MGKDDLVNGWIWRSWGFWYKIREVRNFGVEDVIWMFFLYDFYSFVIFFLCLLDGSLELKGLY